MTEQERAIWVKDRVGKITASRITDVLAKAKSGSKDATTRENYKADLVCERLTGDPTPDGFQSWEMKYGIEIEPIARTEYELKQEVTIENVGFMPHTRFPFSGASPDGLLGDDGLVQFKCPKPAIHLDYIRNNRVPTKYIPQMQWEMACTGRAWSDFVSYNPRFPEHLRLFVKRLERDPIMICELEQEVVRFNCEIDAAIEAVDPSRESPLLETLTRSVEQANVRKLEVTAEDGAAIGIPIEQQAQAAQEKVVALRRGKIPDNPNPHDFESAGDVVNRAGIRRVVEAARSGE